MHPSESCALCYHTALEHILRNEYNEAIAHLSLAIEQDAHSPDAYFARGICYHQLEEKDLAVEDMIRSSDLGLTEARMYLYEFASEKDHIRDYLASKCLDGETWPVTWPENEDNINMLLLLFYTL